MTLKTKQIYHYFLMILGPLALFFVASYFLRIDSLFTKLTTFKFSSLLILVLLQFLHLALLTFIQKSPLVSPLVKTQTNLKSKEWFGLCVLGEFFNQILPAKSGSGIRMLYIHDKTGLKLKEILSMSLAMCLIGFTLAGILIQLFISNFKTSGTGLFSVYESLAYSLMFSGILLLFAQEIIFKFRKKKNQYSPLRYLKDSNIFLKILSGWGLIFCLYPIKILFAFKSLGVNLEVYQIFEMSLVLLLTTMVHIIPGNLGIKELLITFLASKYGISYEEALLICLIERFSLFIILFPMGLYYYWELIFNKSKIKMDLFKVKKWVQTSP